MTVLRWDLETKLGRYDHILEEEEERRRLEQRIRELEQKIQKLEQNTKKERLIDVDSDCEIWS